MLLLATSFRRPVSLRRREFCAALLATTATGAAAGPAAYPPRVVRMISPYAPGGGTDILGRLIAQAMSEAWGTATMIVENRPGAGGNLGAQSVSRAAPDGTTLLMAVNSHAINASVYRRIPFDLLKDFAPVGRVATSPFVFVVNAALPVRSMAELVAYARARPGQLNYGSAGIATAPHLAGELVNLTAGTAMTHIPYQGSGPNVTALLRNEVQLSAISLNSIEGMLKDGKVRVLATTGASRYPGLPDVPTVAESGLPGYEVDLWYALLAPAGTPPEIVARLSGDLRQVLAPEAMRERLRQRGYEAAWTSPADLAALMRKDVERWKAVTAAINLKID
jgi:tripartite-type tricarboxylate transporter receptor subunit TctC